MHIPEGYLGPATWGASYLAMAPIWVIAGRKLRRSLSQRRVPLLAIGAAFSFVIMMFNVPIPGGSKGHATGAPLIAILLGPWAAVLAVSVVLAVQAFLFGDGGITALGANCLNMAFVMPFVSYGVYRLVAMRSAATAARRIFAAGLAGYVGLNAAAITTGFMFGIQPALAHGPDGRPLYSPFGLNVALPVMAAGHLLVFGFVEAAVTAIAVAYLARTEPDLIVRPAATAEEVPA
ncbi:MAG: cobalt transporter CbiM [Xanthomonadales bacterium]|nr:cobalt transporter CbiM [Xanthomonadales bacterium]NIO13277.1 cobalt transporter CbiM [Xanthomonadales bacterium]